MTVGACSRYHREMRFEGYKQQPLLHEPPRETSPALPGKKRRRRFWIIPVAIVSAATAYILLSIIMFFMAWPYFPPAMLLSSAYEARHGHPPVTMVPGTYVGSWQDGAADLLTLRSGGTFVQTVKVSGVWVTIRGRWKYDQAAGELTIEGLNWSHSMEPSSVPQTVPCSIDLEVPLGRLFVDLDDDGFYLKTTPSGPRALRVFEPFTLAVTLNHPWALKDVPATGG